MGWRVVRWLRVGWLQCHFENTSANNLEPFHITMHSFHIFVDHSRQCQMASLADGNESIRFDLF